MNLSRREFVQLLGIASASGMLPTNALAARNPAAMYDQKKFGNVCLMHMTDCHAQLNPIYFREPNVNIGVGGSKGKAPHMVTSFSNISRSNLELSKPMHLPTWAMTRQPKPMAK
jgi:sulfur-oxidizing protein SoxB